MNNITHISGNTSGLTWENVIHAIPDTESGYYADAQSVNAQSPIVDSVKTRSASVQPTLIADEDVEHVLAESMRFIREDPASALHVHSGLDASRVAALLTM